MTGADFWAQLADPRLQAAKHQWDSFCATIEPGDVIGIVHHGDLDGAIGAAYAQSSLQMHWRDLKPRTYWVATDEYDFIRLREWAAEQKLDRCFFFDMSIVNNRDAINALSGLVRRGIFIFDHHLRNEPDFQLPESVTLANPTPATLGPGESPVPTFLFALALAQSERLAFPDWLVVLSTFAEGVDDFFAAPLGKAVESVPEIPKAGSSLRERYNRSPLSRVSALIRAAYARRSKDDDLVPLISQIATGEMITFSDFFERLERNFRTTADDISAQISRLVDEWKPKIHASGDRLTVIKVDGPHAVVGPVVSILRGRYPDRVMLGVIESDERAIVELRTGNRMPIDFVAILRRVGEHVHLFNYGGHASAAGASFPADELENFIRRFRSVLQTSPDGRG